MNEEVERIFPQVWNDLLENRKVVAQDKPLGVVLGGVPGSGKSILIGIIEKQLDGNVIPINGDDFRIYHPDFKNIYSQYGSDYPIYTSNFSNKMVEKVIEEAIKNKFNVIIEGTFRSSEVPIGTLSNLKNQGYDTKAMVIATEKDVAWKSTIDRYENDKRNGFYARKVDKKAFDFIANNLAKNAKSVFDSGKANSFEIYSREGKLFDSLNGGGNDIEKIINQKLNASSQKQNIKSDISSLFLNKLSRYSKLDPVKPISVKELYQVEQGLSQSHKLKKTKVFKR